jgi:hypothetical protein
MANGPEDIDVNDPSTWVKESTDVPGESVLRGRVCYSSRLSNQF